MSLADGSMLMNMYYNSTGSIHTNHQNKSLKCKLPVILLMGYTIELITKGVSTRAPVIVPMIDKVFMYKGLQCMRFYEDFVHGWMGIMCVWKVYCAHAVN